MEQFLKLENNSLIIALVSFVVLLTLIFFIYRRLFLFLKKRALRTKGKLDDFVLDLFKIPALWLIYWILLKVFTHIFLKNLEIFPVLSHINLLLLIFSIAWISVQSVKAASYYLEAKFNIAVANNLNARKSQTQIRVFKGIVNTVIIIIAIAGALLTFEKARAIGLSLLTSAGIIGIIVGFAAQKSIGMILAGIQLAITQPIRIDDVVIVESEWGRIEEITLTYVVVKIWDERRMVLPVNYFLEKPFQNWTRASADITGTIFLLVDFSFPAEAVRNILPDLLKSNPNWDGRLVNVQVTDSKENYKEIRILLSSSDASRNWDLRADIREKLIDFINLNYPGSFAKLRLENMDSPVNENSKAL